MKFIKIALLASAVVSTSIFAQNLLLSCTVKGSFDSQPIEPATISVKIENSKSFLNIDVDGPADYQGGFSSIAVDTSVIRSEGLNVSDTNTFALNEKTTMKASGNFYDTSIKITRTTGMFYLLQYSTIKGRTFLKDVSGECRKISSANKF
jgi:hypothetical protein